MDKFADCTMRGVRSTTKLYKQKDVQERGFAEMIVRFYCAI
jgi:hypothetical protein